MLIAKIIIIGLAVFIVFAIALDIALRLLIISYFGSDRGEHDR